MKPHEKNVKQETDVKQDKPAKRVLRATDLRHAPAGIPVTTGVKAGPSGGRKGSL